MALGAGPGNDLPIIEGAERPTMGLVGVTAGAVAAVAVDAANSFGGVDTDSMLDSLFGMTESARLALRAGAQWSRSSGDRRQHCETYLQQPHATLAP